MPTVLVQGRIAAPKADLMRRHAPRDWSVTVWNPDTDDVADFESLALDADVIVGGGIPISWPDVPKLKLFQIPWTGYDFTAPHKMPPGVPVANTFEHESSISEYVMLGMLEWQIGLRHMDAEFRESGWGGYASGRGPTHREAKGSTVGIVGYGHIGREVAARANAFGMRCIGVRRSEQACPAELDWLGQPDRLDELLAESDFVVIACDMNEATIGLIDAARLTAMKPTGVIINVARGRIVDENALYDALESRRIGGAIIDTWYSYYAAGEESVWPCSRPFQDLDNTLLSGHRSGTTEEMHDRRWRFVGENCARIGLGETAENIVFYGKGASD
jgi:phosphoglycerate dehydrogenase-like enzyme